MERNPHREESRDDRVIPKNVREAPAQPHDFQCHSQRFILRRLMQSKRETGIQEMHMRMGFQTHTRE